MNEMNLLWALFGVSVVVVAALDLLVATRASAPVRVSAALKWTALWISVAIGFGVAIWQLHPGGADVALLFLAGYLTEYSLSVDNLFVFVMIFSLMGVPEVAQPKLIKLGIYLAIVLRVIFILFGVVALHHFHWLIYGFGLLLIWTAWKMLVTNADDQMRPEQNVFYRLARKWLPMRAEEHGEKRLFLREEGRFYFTNYFLVFLVIGSTDVLFAVDSIPAIMGISEDPFIVVTSNIFAVLGLNSLFFALRGLMHMFRYLKTGVCLILLFIGLKMLTGLHEPLGTWFAGRPFIPLGVIGVILLVSVVVSLLKRTPSAPAH